VTTTVVKTIGVGGDYTTLQSWEDAAPANLVTADQVWQGQINASTDSFSGSSTLLTMSGSTSDATRYKELTTAAGASFIDNANILTNALRYSTANGCYITSSVAYAAAVVLNEAYARARKVQVLGTNNCYSMSLGQATVLVEQSILSSSGATFAAASLGTLRNCLIYRTGVARTEIMQVSPGGEIDNCTIATLTATTYVFNAAGYGTTNIKNSCFYNASTGLKTGTGTLAYTTCFNDLASPPSGVTQAAYDTSTGSGFQNISTGTQDYRIKSGSAMIDVGTTLGSVTVDIAGTSRPQGSAYDVGCWELAAGLTITTAHLPAGLGAMGGGQTRAFLPAGVGYMG
jgi:hypothetical protein